MKKNRNHNMQGEEHFQRPCKFKKDAEAIISCDAQRIHLVANLISN